MSASPSDASGALASYALAEARRAAERDDFAQALDWLGPASGSVEGRGLEVEVRYRYGAVLAAQRRYSAAEGQFARALSGGGPLAPLLAERTKLLRGRGTTTRDLRKLRVKFGKSCSTCDGDDLYRIATCRHQFLPIPLAKRVPWDMLAPTVAGVYAAAAYRAGWDPERSHPLSMLVRREKERIDGPALRLLGAMLADFVAYHTPLPSRLDAVVPVPTSLEREERRGGGIPHSLAVTLRDELVLPLHELIVQIGPHLDHTEARGPQRANSLRKVWRARPAGGLAGRTVLLVDDILTTGLTMSTAAQLLLEAGVGRVYGVALMHTERSS